MDSTSPCVVVAAVGRLRLRNRRVLICIPTMEGGGAERQVANLAHGLAAEAWDVHVALVRKGSNFSALVDSAAEVHFLRASSLGLVTSLMQAICRIRPAVINTWLPAMDIVGGAVAAAARVPWVATERSSAAAYPQSVRNRVRANLLPRASFVIANSQCGLEYLLLNGCRPDAVVQISNSVAEVRSVRRFTERRDTTRVLAAGRLTRAKDLPTLLRGFSTVALALPDVTFEICGTGPLFQYCAEWIAAHALQDRVNLCGYDAALMTRMQESDMYVSASRFEGQPNTVLEAMALGCPALLSDIPAHRQLAGGCASYFPVGDACALADAVIRHARDPSDTHGRARQAQALARQHSVPRISAEFAAVYDRAAARKVSDPR